MDKNISIKIILCAVFFGIALFLFVYSKLKRTLNNMIILKNKKKKLRSYFRKF